MNIRKRSIDAEISLAADEKSASTNLPPRKESRPDGNGH
jgi:hypothetical protein